MHFNCNTIGRLILAIFIFCCNGSKNNKQILNTAKSIFQRNIFKTSKLFKKFGVKIENIDLKKVNHYELNGLLNLLSKESMILFKNQIFEDKQLYEFCNKIGELHLSARSISFAPKYKEIVYLTNILNEDGTNLGFPGNTTDYWHIDQEYRLNPATLSSLYCLIPTPIGGATYFASTLIKNLTLPDETLNKLKTYKVAYKPAKSHDNVDHIEVLHPAILLNPYTKESSVYLSENVLGFHNGAYFIDNNLKNYILEMITAENNVYKHNWEMGDFILFDNTQMLHKREAFEGIRWIKGSKIFAPKEIFAIPVGKKYEPLENLKKYTQNIENSDSSSIKKWVDKICDGSEEDYKNLQVLLRQSFSEYKQNKNLCIPKTQVIRAGKAGGLPFDSLVSDLYIGCLSASNVCYGNCFAAKNSFESGFDFGKRIENTLNTQILTKDLTKLPNTQGYLRCGWNSDPSWNWDKAFELAKIIRKNGKLTIFITKAFKLLSEECLYNLVKIKSEIRISISAFDNKNELIKRLTFLDKYTKLGGIAIPIIISAS